MGFGTGVFLFPVSSSFDPLLTPNRFSSPKSPPPRVPTCRVSRTPSADDSWVLNFLPSGPSCWTLDTEETSNFRSWLRTGRNSKGLPGRSLSGYRRQIVTPGGVRTPSGRPETQVEEDATVSGGVGDRRGCRRVVTVTEGEDRGRWWCLCSGREKGSV